MKTRLTVLAVLLFAGASQAALAQDPSQDHWHNPGERQVRPPPAASAPPPAPQAAPRAAPSPGPAPGAGQWSGHHWNGGDRPQPQPAAPPVAQPQPGQHFGGGDRRFDSDRHDGDHRFQDDRRFGDRSRFGPGGTADGDRRWDRRDAPREVVPPGPNAERGWDRDHDGHGPAPNYAGRPPRDGDHRWSGDDRRWDRDHDGYRDRRGPPADWRRWERGRFPPIYAAPHRFHVGPYRPPYGWYVRNWGFGDFLPRGWFGESYWVDDFWYYDLPYPPPGAHWVRVGDDALLVDDYSGRIMQVVRDIFW